jgi:protocatechuate 3,4-dioxygenase beta subunit
MERITQMSEYLSFDPPYHDPEYSVTTLRAPVQPPVHLPGDWFHNVQGPVFDSLRPGALDFDLTRQHPEAPVGERVILFGKVTDSDDRPVRNSLIEIWQANSAGRYVDVMEAWGLPSDPNFTGAGRCLTNDQGNYRFVTVRPGPYPAPYTPTQMGWRAAHIHFSLFGAGFSSRLITQMYFEGDPLLRQDRIYNGIPDARARDLLVAKLDLGQTFVDLENTLISLAPVDEEGRLVINRTKEHTAATDNRSAVAYRFDIVLRGRGATPLENRA